MCPNGLNFNVSKAENGIKENIVFKWGYNGDCTSHLSFNQTGGRIPLDTQYF